MEDREHREYVIYADDRKFEYHIEKGLEPTTNAEWYDFMDDNTINDEERKFLLHSEHIRVYAILPSICDGLLIAEFDTAEVFKEGNKSIREAAMLHLQGDVEEHNEEGIKYDGGKPMPGTAVEIFPRALMEIGRCIEYGTHKYPDVHNWEKLEDAERRYRDALMRHLIKYVVGSEIDAESGIYHLAHAAWNALALCELFLKTKELGWEERGKENENRV